MSLLRVTSNLQQATATQTIIGSNNTAQMAVILPVVGDGTGATVDNGVRFLVMNEGTGGLEVLDSAGHRVWYVRPNTAVVLKSTDEPAGVDTGGVRWVAERPAQVEALKITDLTATNLVAAMTGCAVDFAAAYVEAAIEAASNLALTTVTDNAINLAHATFDEMQDKVNLLEAALLIGLGSGLATNANADGDTLALADSGMHVDQLVDDSEDLVTSAHARAQTIVLPQVSDGTGLTVDDGFIIRIEANGIGPIIVNDYEGRRVGYVPGNTNAYVQSSNNAVQPWQFFKQGSYEMPLGSLAFFSYTPMVLSTGTSPTVTPASAFPAAYTNDATFNTAADVGIDAAFDELDAAVDAIFDEFQARLNTLLLTFEASGLMATS